MWALQSPLKSLEVLLILFNPQVVDKDSAIIDGSHKIGFETDHRNMQRFPNQEDEDYRNILVWIRHWMGQANEEAHSKCPYNGNTIVQNLA